MSLSYDTKRDLYVALTRYNYFPNQKDDMGELPPCFSSRQFTPEICHELATLCKGPDRSKCGYDIVEYKATRYNNVARKLALIHPKPYSHLVEVLMSNWDKIEYICDNENSLIKPEVRQDGRYFVMNYEDGLNKNTRVNKLSFGKKFRVSTDIANCFNSVYSHAIPWALVGKDEAKKNRKKSEWFNGIDAVVRDCKRGETQGIAIGPGTSSIVVEIILSAIDKKLKSAGYSFERYVDDYNCYCSTDQEAEGFIILLERCLSEYKLTLNLSKTSVTELPFPKYDDWVLELLGALPPTEQETQDDESVATIFTTPSVLTFLNHALRINKRTPDGSVLKYALKLVIDKLQNYKIDNIFQEVLHLSWHYPVLIPFLERLAEKYDVHVEAYVTEINDIIKENALKRRSDGICWPLHILFRHDLSPMEDTVSAIISSEDCLGITLLAEHLNSNPSVMAFVNSLLESDIYTKDNYWILLYQLYLGGFIDNPYSGDETFELLKKFDVNFLPRDTVTDAELKSDQIAYKHIFEDIDNPIAPEF